MINVNQLIGTHDVVLMTLDTLRYDVAARLWREGGTPNLRKHLPPGGWEERHSPGNFTFAAHSAFFAGFLPTPAAPRELSAPLFMRPFAISFGGSETTGERTCVFDTPDIVRGLESRGYHTVCIGGVGFFNPESALGRVLPSLFQESHWSREMGVTDPDSTRNQVALAVRILEREKDKRVFLFCNVSALHQPNRHYLPGATEDSLASHAAALTYVDSQLPPLFEALRKRGPSYVIICSDHGTAYGEDGYWGHRLSHPTVWTVPYAEFVLEGMNR